MNLCLKNIFLFIAFILNAFISAAQVTPPDTSMMKILADTTSAKARYENAQKPIVYTSDTSILTKRTFVPNPKKSGMYSALLPGAGQFYNRQYWKIPVIYAGFAVVGYFFNYNQTNYNNFHTAYISRIAHASSPVDKYANLYTLDNLKQLQDEYQKDLDLTVLIGGIGYILQVMDAVVYAYLHNFDISRDISMHMLPVKTPSGSTIGFVVNFK
jgi:hypothetical protein